MQDLITAAEQGFASTTGFSVSSLVDWSVTNLLLVWVGSGVALLYELRYVIAALLILGAIIYFAFRAFRFFRH